MASGLHCCTFCGSVMRLLLLPAADGSGKVLCCWGCEAAGRMDHVCWTDDSLCRDCGGAARPLAAASALLGAVDTAVDGCYACEDCGQPLAAGQSGVCCAGCQAVRNEAASWRTVGASHYATMPLATVVEWPAATRRAVKRCQELARG